MRTNKILNYESILQVLGEPSASALDSIMERSRNRLIEDLTRPRDEYQPDSAQWGLLGHAAEFLVSQRGLHP